MKKHGWMILLTVGLAFVLAYCLYIQRGSVAEAVLTPSVSFRVFSASGAYEDILCWAQDEKRCYVFLPSYADLNRTEVRLKSPQDYQLGEIKLEQGLNCGVFALDTDYQLTGGGLSPRILQFVQSANVAAMYIDTITGSMDRVHADKSYKERAAVTVYTAAGEMDYQGDFVDQIKGHGNTTWKYEKKPYDLYFQQKTGLLHMEPGSNWVLLSNARDASNLRNKLILDFAREVEGYDGFAPQCEFVEVYFNGEYNGLYLVCEKVKAAENRPNISENIVLLDLELAHRASKTNSFPIHQGVSVEIVYPNTITNNEMEGVKGLLLDFQAALLSSSGVSPYTGKAWNDFIDLDSWARKYLIEEISENLDAGACSQFFFINSDDNKIYAGPCWDYDSTWGVSVQKSARIFLAQREWKDVKTYTPWFYELWKKEEFRDRVITLYQTVFSPKLKTLLSQTIDEENDSIAEASRNNAMRWKPRFPDTTAEQMRSFLRERIAFLDSAWIDGVVYRTITLKGINQYLFYTAKDGTVCEELPSPASLGVNGGSKWYREDDDEPFDYDSIITEDLSLYAKTKSKSISTVLTAFILFVFLMVFLFLCFIGHRRNQQGRRHGHA